MQTCGPQQSAKRRATRGVDCRAVRGVDCCTVRGLTRGVRTLLRARVSGLGVLCLFAAIVPSAAAAQAVPASPATTLAEAREAVAQTRAAVRASYDARRRHSRAAPPREQCDETRGEDCFGGDVECGFVNACAWPGGREAMTALAELYDRTAAVVRRAPPELDPELGRWIEGQRTGAWTRLGEFRRARQAVAECTSYGWWCAALDGYIAHREGRYPEAEQRFRTALAGMPAGRACYWNELTLYRDTTARSVRHGGSAVCPDPAERDAVWRLADPLFSRPGNDRMTEHYARHVEMAIHEDFLVAWEGSHTAAHHSIVLRLGWPTGFRVVRLLQDAAMRTELLHGGGAGFMVLTDPEAALRLPAAAFEPRPDDRREQYRPSYGPVTAVPVQYGFVRRDGAPLLLVRASAPAVPAAASDAAATADPAATVPAATAGGWQLLSWNGSEWRRGAAAAADGAVTAELATPWEAQLFSLERFGEGGAWRGRSGTQPPTSSGSAAVSSILLLDGGAPAGSAAEVAAAMLPGTTLPADADVAAWWEIYSVAAHNAAVQLTTRRLDRPGLLARLLGRAPPAARTVRWEEQLQPVAGATARRVHLDLAGMAAGDYLLSLLILLDDGSRLSATTTFRIESR
jgi:hypothetical protein